MAPWGSLFPCFFRPRFWMRFWDPSGLHYGATLASFSVTVRSKMVPKRLAEEKTRFSRNKCFTEFFFMIFRVAEGQNGDFFGPEGDFSHVRKRSRFCIAFGPHKWPKLPLKEPKMEPKRHQKWLHPTCFSMFFCVFFFKNIEFEIGIHYPSQHPEKDENSRKNTFRKLNIEKQSGNLIRNPHRDQHDFQEKQTKNREWQITTFILA